ncbi:MAG: hypothetical protein EZS28_049617, partial [Streblomastix strix]
MSLTKEQREDGYRQRAYMETIMDLSEHKIDQKYAAIQLAYYIDESKQLDKQVKLTDEDVVTGSCLDLNKMKDNQLVILDFDIPHNEDEYNKEFYRNVIINDHLPKGTPVLITAHGGLHAYVHRYDYPLKSNRLVASKKIPFTGFAVDIFAQIEKHKTADGKPNGIIENR